MTNGMSLQEQSSGEGCLAVETLGYVSRVFSVAELLLTISNAHVKAGAVSQQ